MPGISDSNKRQKDLTRKGLEDQKAILLVERTKRQAALEFVTSADGDVAKASAQLAEIESQLKKIEAELEKLAD